MTLDSGEKKFNRSPEFLPIFFGQMYGKIVRLKVQASDKKMRKTDIINTETLRVVSS